MNNIKAIDVLVNFKEDPNYFKTHMITVNGQNIKVQNGETSPKEKEKCIALWKTLMKKGNNRPNRALIRKNVFALAENQTARNDRDLLPLFNSIITNHKISVYETYENEKTKETIPNLSLAQIIHSNLLLTTIDEDLNNPKKPQDIPFTGIDKKTLQLYLNYSNKEIISHTPSELIDILKMFNYLDDIRPTSLITDQFKNFSLEQCLEAITLSIPRVQHITEELLMDRIADLCKDLDAEKVKDCFLQLSSRLGGVTDQITYLNLSSTKISMKELHEITSLFPNITSLKIGTRLQLTNNNSSLTSSEASFDIFSETPFNLSKLSKLEITSTHLTNDHLALFKASPIKELNICSCQKITTLPLFSHLVHLDAIETGLTDEGIANLTHSPLKELHIRYCKKITTLPLLPHLITLDATWTGLTNDGIANLTNSPLQELVIRDCQEITELPLLPHLVKLTAAGTGL